MGGDSFFNQVKKCWFHPGEVSVAWYISSDRFIQECSVATSLFPQLYPGHDPWILWLPSPSGVGVMVMLVGQVLGSAVFSVW